MSLDLARAIAAAVRADGGRALIVGGWVRDHLLAEPQAEVPGRRSASSRDIDLEVFGIPADRLRPLLERFGRVEAVGQAFPVYKVMAKGARERGGEGARGQGGEADAIDVALPRRESKSGRGHKAFTVVGDPFMPLEEAARRRDFTVNAIAWDPLTGVYEDPFGGRADLERRLLRAVDPRTFGDDSLRVLRAVQFAARFALTLEDETAGLCRRIPLDDLPAERVWGEIEKLLLDAARPSIGLALALDLGVVDAILPEMKPLVGCEQEPDWHPEGDVWTHTLMVVDKARELNGGLERPQLVTIMLGAICHDLGKPATTAVMDGRIRSMNHEDAGVAPTRALLDRLNIHSIDGFDVRGQVVGLVAHHLKPGMFHKAPHVSESAFRRLSLKVDLELLARLARADCLGRTGHFDCSAMDWFLERARALGVEHRPPPSLLLGRHLLALGLSPGPRVGEVLKTVYEQQLDGQVSTVDEAIQAAKTILQDAR